jgi:hypothetical protein
MSSIKLVDIVRELSLHKGDASNYDSSQLFSIIVDTFIPNKKDYYFDDDKINEKIPVKNFIKDISKYIVSEQGSNKLIAKKDSYELSIALINTEASSLDLVCIGRISLDLYDNDLAIKTPTIYQIGWSIIANEYLRADFGKLMYFLTYDYISSLGALMASDSVLYSGSFRMWTKFMSSIAPYFGVIIQGMILPVSKDDLEKAGKTYDIDGFVAMKKYLPMMEKINKVTAGLSFMNGDYGFADLITGDYTLSSKDLYFIRPKTGDQINFYQAVDQANKSKKSLEQFVKYIEDELSGEITLASKKKNLKCVIFSFTDTMLAVKQQGNKLTITSI